MVSLEKKALKHPKANEELRTIFNEKIKAFEESNHPIIYLDESGFESTSFRPYGYTIKGKPCYATYNWQPSKRTNAIGAIKKGGNLFAVGLFDCSVNSDVFHGWVTHTLVPELPANSVVVMDNATFHKRADTLDAIKTAGHQVVWLPPYSPDLNPIEKTWAWVKQLRKEWRVDCIETLFFWILTIISFFK